MDSIHGLPIYDFVIDDNDPNDGVAVMSLVEKPASEKTFLALSEDQKVQVNLAFNDQKQIVTGVALRANHPIYRDQDGKKFFFRLSETEIEKIMHKFMREGRNTKVNLQHDKGTEEIDGIYLIESFLFKKYHTEEFPMFADVEPGSWMVSYKVDNPDVWAQVKSEKINGFSPELRGTNVATQLEEHNQSIQINEIIQLINLL